MPLPLTVACFSKIQIGFTILVLADPGSPGKRVVKCVCVGVHCACRSVKENLLKALITVEVEQSRSVKHDQQIQTEAPDSSGLLFNCFCHVSVYLSLLPVYSDIK